MVKLHNIFVDLADKSNIK